MLLKEIIQRNYNVSIFNQTGKKTHCKWCESLICITFLNQIFSADSYANYEKKGSSLDYFRQRLNHIFFYIYINFGKIIWFTCFWLVESSEAKNSNGEERTVEERQTGLCF